MGDVVAVQPHRHGARPDPARQHDLDQRVAARHQVTTVGQHLDHEGAAGGGRGGRRGDDEQPGDETEQEQQTTHVGDNDATGAASRVPTGYNGAMKRALAVLFLLGVLSACSDSGDGAAAPTEAETVVELDEDLQAELLQMMEDDQASRTGGKLVGSDQERTDRLGEIIAEHGWPTWDLVGKDGEEAAWVIAQHSDLDPEFQAEALELLRAAVEDGQASPGNLAYLEDRVLAGKGEPLVYGTQMGCTRKGKVIEPEIVDPEGLAERREEAGLPPYEDYLEEMAEGCASW